MAFNPSPKVAEARALADKHGKNKVIILMIDETTMEYASYGRTRQECYEAKELADAAYEAVYDALAAQMPRVDEV